MKNMGWQFFFALLLADIIGIVMLALSVKLKIVLIVSAIIFVVLAVVLFFGSNARERIKKREQQAVAKIADLQDQVEEALNKKKNPTESSVH
ncbi:MAG: hypothetical protein IKR33_07315 [Bacteroidales bacterium]|nr:hypothetical protein [Bacteroidales bacterium]